MEYMTLLSQQAAPHNVRAIELNDKLKEFWADKNFISAYQSQYNTAQQGVRRMIDLEVSKIRALAPEELKARLVMNPPTKNPTVQPNLMEMEVARELVRKEPMNLSHLESLLKLGAKNGVTGHGELFGKSH